MSNQQPQGPSTAGVPAIVSIDWGTTSFRAYLADSAGRELAQIATGDGILKASHEGFAAVLARVLTPWADRISGLPVLMSGMIGSRQGWSEAAYAPCPAGLDDIADALTAVEVAPASDAGPAFGPVRIVPGLMTRDATGVPDVMRGEECQVFGALAASSNGGQGPSTVILPGTHSKWVEVRDGRITGFCTYMTGEVFQAVSVHTILSRTIAAEAPFSLAAFERGCRAGLAGGRQGAVLSRLFSTRTLGLFGELAEAEGRDYLSGLLIGSEVGDRLTAGQGPAIVIASDDLTRRYQTAIALAGGESVGAPAACVVAAHTRLARHAGLLTPYDPSEGPAL